MLHLGPTCAVKTYRVLKMTNALVKPGYYVTVSTICNPLSRITSLFEPNFDYYKNYTFFSNTKHVFTVSIIYRLLKCSFNEISNHHRIYNLIKSHIIVTCLFFNGYRGSSTRAKRPGRETDHSPPPSAEVTN